MSNYVYLFKSQADQKRGIYTTAQVGSTVLAAVKKAATGQGERKSGNLSNTDVAKIEKAIVSTGSKGMPNMGKGEKTLLKFVREAGSNDRNNAVIMYGNDEFVINATNGKKSGEAAAKVGSSEWMGAISKLGVAANFNKAVKGS